MFRKILTPFLLFSILRVFQLPTRHRQLIHLIFFFFAHPTATMSKYPPPCVMGDEAIMSPKDHGTSAVPVQQNLRWKCDLDTADRICNVRDEMSLVDVEAGLYIGTCTTRTLEN